MDAERFDALLRTFSETPDQAMSAARILEWSVVRSIRTYHSYVGEDKKTTFCLYDGPSLEAV